MKNTLRKRKHRFTQESGEYRAYLKAHGMQVRWEYMPPLDFNERETEPSTDGVPRMRYAEDDKIIHLLKKEYGKGGYRKVTSFESVNACLNIMKSY